MMLSQREAKSETNFNEILNFELQLIITQFIVQPLLGCIMLATYPILIYQGVHHCTKVGL